jgi:hypothetical protein
VADLATDRGFGRAICAGDERESIRSGGGPSSTSRRTAQARVGDEGPQAVRHGRERVVNFDRVVAMVVREIS